MDIRLTGCIQGWVVARMTTQSNSTSGAIPEQHLRAGASAVGEQEEIPGGGSAFISDTTNA
jgi:hypothetical protein